CVRRSVALKVSPDSLNEPQQAAGYSEATNVIPPGTGAGQSGEDLFAYYDQNGNPVNIGNGMDISVQSGADPLLGVHTLASIKTVKINLSLLNNQVDLTNNQLDRASISATARLNQ